MSEVLPENQATTPPQTLWGKLFEFSPDAIFITNAAGRIANANSQVERLFGYSRNELIDQPVEILIPDRFRQVHPSHRRAFGVNPQLRPMGIGLELFARRKDGTEFPVDIMLSPVESGGERYVWILGLGITGASRCWSEK